MTLKLCGDNFRGVTPIDGRPLTTGIAPRRPGLRWTLSAGSDGGMGANGYIGGTARILVDPKAHNSVIHARYRIDNLSGSPHDSPGIVLRYVDASNYWYLLANHGVAASTANRWQLRSVVSGSDTVHANSTVNPSDIGFDVNGSYDIWLAAIGQTLTVFVAAIAPLTAGGRPFRVLNTNMTTSYETVFRQATLCGLNAPTSAPVEWRLFEVWPQNSDWLRR